MDSVFRKNTAQLDSMQLAKKNDKGPFNDAVKVLGTWEKGKETSVYTVVVLRT